MSRRIRNLKLTLYVVPISSSLSSSSSLSWAYLPWKLLSYYMRQRTGQQQTHPLCNFFDLLKLDSELGLFLTFFPLEQLNHLPKFSIGSDLFNLSLFHSVFGFPAATKHLPPKSSSPSPFRKHYATPVAVQHWRPVSCPSRLPISTSRCTSSPGRSLAVTRTHGAQRRTQRCSNRRSDHHPRV
jgi:hypothetical protein